MLNQKMLNQKEKHSPLTIALSVLLSVIFVAVIAFASFTLWVHQNCFVVEVSGDSMLNTVQSGDLLYVRDGKAKRGDVVIISVQNYTMEGGFHFSGKYIIKRLIATEGDTVKCEDGVVSVMYAGSDKFVALSEPYIKGITPNFDNGGEITVGEGEIFFLGDNRENSYDSTEIGCLLEEDIVGVVPKWALKIKSFTKFWEKMRSTMAVHQ